VSLDLYQPADIAEAAGALRVADLAGALALLCPGDNIG
jgi:hypothetical protein